MDHWSLILEIVALLGLAMLFGAFAAKVGQSPLLGYLVAGMALGGPSSLGFVQSERDIEAIAELGVALLLFSLGLEFSWRELRRLGSRVLLAGSLQVIATTLFAALTALALGLGVKESIAVGAMLSLSSTACVIRVLIDRHDIDSPHGRSTVAVLLVQDMAVVPLAILVTALSGTGTATEVGLYVGTVVASAALFISVLYLILNKFAVRILHSFTVAQNRELTILMAIVIGLGATVFSHKAGLSPALGAFLAGMIIGASPFAVQVRSDVSSIRVALLTLFFGAVGMVADVFWIINNLGMLLALTVLLVFGKVIITWASMRMFRINSLVAITTSINLAQVGEFAFVLGAMSRSSGIISSELHTTIISLTIISLILTPYLVALAPRAATWFSRFIGQPLPGEPSAGGKVYPEIVIIGFGPAGLEVGKTLAGRASRVAILDLNPAVLSIADELGFVGHVGDAQQFETLQHLHLDGAKIVVITLPTLTSALNVLAHVRRIAPSAYVIVRSRYQQHHGDFEDAGAHEIAGDEVEVGRQLARLTRKRLIDAKSEATL